MSSNASITLAWADGDYLFRLPIGQLRELQEKCGAGPMVIYQRLHSGEWRVDDVRETLRLGLIGGGMKPVEALVLVKRYVDERPWAENVLPATAVILAAVMGVPDDKVGKPEAETTTTEATDASSSPRSTARARSSAGQPARSTN
jgi:hypothetical protein